MVKPGCAVVKTKVPHLPPNFAAGPSRTAQVAEWFAREIRSGRIAPGDKLPTEQELIGRFGGTGLGNMYRSVVAEAAIATVQAAYAAGIRYFDTAPVYGFGLSETRLGEAIRGFPRRDIVISSKVGYDLVPIPREEMKPALWDDPLPMKADFDYSRDAVMRSLEGTLRRLGVDAVDMVSIHDPDEAIHFGPGEDPYARSRFHEAMDGAYPALDELRSQGVIKAVGVGINQ